MGDRDMKLDRGFACPVHGVIARYAHVPPTHPTVCSVVIDEKKMTKCGAELLPVQVG